MAIMPEFSRRGFLKLTTAGTTAIGVESAQAAIGLAPASTALSPLAKLSALVKAEKTLSHQGEMKFFASEFRGTILGQCPRPEFINTAFGRFAFAWDALSKLSSEEVSVLAEIIKDASQHSMTVLSSKMERLSEQDKQTLCSLVGSRPNRTNTMAFFELAPKTISFANDPEATTTIPLYLQELRDRIKNLLDFCDTFRDTKTGAVLRDLRIPKKHLQLMHRWGKLLTDGKLPELLADPDRKLVAEFTRTALEIKRGLTTPKHIEQYKQLKRDLKKSELSPEKIEQGFDCKNQLKNAEQLYLALAEADNYLLGSRNCGLLPAILRKNLELAFQQTSIDQKGSPIHLEAQELLQRDCAESLGLYGLDLTRAHFPAKIKL